MVSVKICGITDRPALEAAAHYGARFVGFVFYPPSPRSLSLDQASQLARSVPAKIGKVGVFVDPRDDELAATLERVPLDMIQLHGNESLARIETLRARSGRKVVKAIRVARAEDIASARPFAAVADWILYDAKTPAGQGLGLPGGNAIAFDWTLLAGRAIAGREGWLLSGGLSAENVKDAVTITGASVVDVSSGVESAPGHKDPAAVRAFLEAARAV